MGNRGKSKPISQLLVLYLVQKTFVKILHFFDQTHYRALELVGF